MKIKKTKREREREREREEGKEERNGWAYQILDLGVDGAGHEAVAGEGVRRGVEEASVLRLALGVDLLPFLLEAAGVNAQVTHAALEAVGGAAEVEALATHETLHTELDGPTNKVVLPHRCSDRLPFPPRTWMSGDRTAICETPVSTIWMRRDVTKPAAKALLRQTPDEVGAHTAIGRLEEGLQVPVRDPSRWAAKYMRKQRSAAKKDVDNEDGSCPYHSCSLPVLEAAPIKVVTRLDMANF